jgi:hypothetical protein
VIELEDPERRHLIDLRRHRDQSVACRVARMARQSMTRETLREPMSVNKEERTHLLWDRSRLSS